LSEQTLAISGKIQLMPPALLPAVNANAFLISSKEGTSANSLRTSEEGKELIKSKENMLVVFKTELKCC